MLLKIADVFGVNAEYFVYDSIMVDIVLDKEHERILNIRVQESDLLATHVRTDMDQSSKAVQQDLDLMNDDSNWK